jgi:hypothetical protein
VLCIYLISLTTDISNQYYWKNCYHNGENVTYPLKTFFPSHSVSITVTVDDVCRVMKTLNPFTADVAIMRHLGSAPLSHLCDRRGYTKVTGLSDLNTLSRIITRFPSTEAKLTLEWIFRPHHILGSFTQSRKWSNLLRNDCSIATRRFRALQGLVFVTFTFDRMLDPSTTTDKLL